MKNIYRKGFGALLFTCLSGALSAQNFGIGTLTPQQKLDVNGAVRIQTINAAPAAGYRLLVSDGSGVVSFLPGNTTNEVLTWDGAKWISQALPSNASTTDATLTGNGTAGIPLGIAQQGATNGQVLKWNGTTWVPATDNNTTYTGTAPVSVSGTNISLTNGTANGDVLTWNGTNWVSQAVPSSADNWGTQTAATDATLSGNGTAGTPLSLAQQGATNGQVLKWNGATWLPAADNNTTYTAGTGIAISGANAIAFSNGTAAGQLWEWDGANWKLTGNGATNGQVLTWNGTDWVPQSVPSSADNWGTQTAATDATLSGNGTAGTPLSIAQQGAANGQVLKWNGASWSPAADNNTTYTGTAPVSVAGTNISLTNGTTNGDVLTWNGASWVSQAAPSGADNWGAQAAATTARLTGDGTAGTPLDIAQQGAANGQVLTWNGTSWVPQNAPSGADNWGTQTATTDATLSGNGTAGTPLSIAQQGAIMGQVLTWNGASWGPQNPGSGADNWGAQAAATTARLTGDGTAGTPLDIAQQGATNGQVLTWNGTTWVPQNAPSGADNWGTQTAATDATLSGNGAAGTPLSIAQQGATNGQILTWNGTSWVPQNAPSGADNWGTQTAATSARLTGNGTAGTPLDIAQQGAANGDVLKWNGASWAPSADNNTTYTGTAPVSVAGTAISLTNGTANGDVLTWNGTNWVSQAVPSSADNWGTQTAVTDASLKGNGTAGSPLGMAQRGALNGQVLAWNGTDWLPISLAASTFSVQNGLSTSGGAIELGGTLLHATDIAQSGFDMTYSGVGNFGIGTATPAQKLDVAGNVQFSGALMPAGDAGTTGQVLTSQGAGAAPVWSGSLPSFVSTTTVERYYVGGNVSVPCGGLHYTLAAPWVDSDDFAYVCFDDACGAFPNLRINYVQTYNGGIYVNISNTGCGLFGGPTIGNVNLNILIVKN